VSSYSSTAPVAPIASTVADFRTRWCAVAIASNPQLFRDETESLMRLLAPRAGDVPDYECADVLPTD